MGQVLIEFNPEKIVAKTGAVGNDAQLLLNEVLKSKEWVLLDWGRISYEDAYKNVCERLPEHLHQTAYDIINSWFVPAITPIDGMDPLIRELKAMGYNIYLLSNAPTSLHKYIHTLPGMDCFSGTLVSADYALLKPQPEIYEKLCLLFSLKPEECIFIDDNITNIAGAYTCGIKGIQFFGSVEKLREDLKVNGII